MIGLDGLVFAYQIPST